MLSMIILAAGRSSRFGDLKPVYRIRGKSFLERILKNIASAVRPAEIIVGTGFQKEAVQEELKRLSFQGRVVVNRDYEKGPFSTLQACVRASSPESRGFFMILSDHPLVRPRTYRFLRDAFEKTGCQSIIIPVYKGKKGHPVIFPSFLKEEILSLPSGKSARDIIKNHADIITAAECRDPFILADIDDKDMLKQYLKEL